MKLSLVIPAKNEEDNVLELYKEIKHVLDNASVYFSKLGSKDLIGSYEIIFIDDGSTDKTFSKLISIRDKNVKVIKFRKNFGQSASWLAGFDSAKGDVIVTMDSDLQNDPKDIPRLLVKLEEGYDCVSGWRYKRKDPFFKKIFSRISRFLRHRLINDGVNDSGCSLKAYKKECLEGIELFGEMHRYIVSLIKIRGFKVGEIKVRHRPRIRGKTNYKFARLIKGFLDLWNIWFWQKFSSRPLHLFGFLGILGILFGFVTGSYSIYLRLFNGVDLSDTFLPVVAVFSFMVGIQLLVSGILGDAIMKCYNKVKHKKGYEINRIVENK